MRHNGNHRRAQGNQRFVRIAAEIHHAIDRIGDGSVDHGHHQHAEKIKTAAIKIAALVLGHGSRHTLRLRSAHPSIRLRGSHPASESR